MARQTDDIAWGADAAPLTAPGVDLQVENSSGFHSYLEVVVKWLGPST